MDFNWSNLWIKQFLIFLFIYKGQSRILSRDECLSYVASKVPSKYGQNHASKVVNVFQHDPAYLHCKIPLQSVNNLVAWTRLADDALLTVGRRPFSTDTRFQISPKREARDWILNIRRVQLSDAGCYLCEVNTEPQSSIFTVYLNVISRDETTPASTEKSKRKAIVTAKLQGNTILLNCSVEADRHSALDIIWTKNGNTINFLNDTKYKTDFKLLDKTVIYMLTVLDPSKDDDGSYECQGENVATAAEMVHVNSGCYKPGTCFTLLILLFSTLMVAYQV
ncbi:hypothetical protein M3Y97_00840200 [Aphelenchoides bicaudatus]|nr:hypothetical protein M3Y97_00840200 [Aphelenchoides bicaudatus]